MNMAEKDLSHTEEENEIDELSIKPAVEKAGKKFFKKKREIKLNKKEKKALVREFFRVDSIREFLPGKVGRPPLMTEEIVEKLQSLIAGGTYITEACKIVGIDRTTLYKYIANHPNFSTKIQELRIATKAAAESNIVNSIINDGDIANSWRWLEKFDPDFIPKEDNITETTIVRVYEGIIDKSIKVTEISERTLERLSHEEKQEEDGN
jgi:hypothetical protein